MPKLARRSPRGDAARTTPGSIATALTPSPRVLKPAGVTRFATLLLFLSFGWTSYAAAAIQCSDYPPFTLKIYNDTMNYNVYPVISTPTNGVDEWLQGGFNVAKGNLNLQTYGHKFVYRTYLKPVAGISPGGFLTITLPLCSRLVPAPTGQTPDEYIDWWNGGRVYIYANLKSEGRAPPELTQDLAEDQANRVTPLTVGPSCAGCPHLHPRIFKSPTALAANDPAQLTEYTLADVIKGIMPPSPTWSLDLKNVDYDISYVDHVYLPAAMGPIGNPDIGYIGTIQSVGKFRNIMTSFLSHFQGWPRYLSRIDQKPYLRIPGTYNVMIRNNGGELTTIEPPGQDITNLANQYMTCLTMPTTNPVICDHIQKVNAFFLRNYAAYRQLVIDGVCTPPTGIPPVTPTLNDVLAHVYGWVPWNGHCGGGGANALANDAAYPVIHKKYISLQYLPPLGTFNPYVNLVHGMTYLNMPGSYAFSIDDDVGNMHVAGTGIVIAVGGKNGLENQVQYDPKLLVNVNLGDPNPVNRPLWSQYGFCDGIPVRNISSLSIQLTSVTFPCTVGLTDGAGRTYTFTIASPPFPAGPPGSPNPISNCSAPTTEPWCTNLRAYTETSPAVRNYVVAGPPPPLPRQ
jgi:hypothetical protein